MLAVLACSNAAAQQAEKQKISFRCALAIDAVITELDRQTDNPVTREALDRIDEDRGEFVCLQKDETTIFVRLQSPDLGVTEGKLTFSVDARTYRVLKTFFGP